MNNENTPSNTHGIYRWLFLLEGIIASVVAIVLFLVSFEGAFGPNVLLGLDAAWIWQPIVSTVYGAVIYAVVFVIAVALAIRRIYLFSHPEHESSVRF